MQVNLKASEKKKLIHEFKSDPILLGLMTSDYSQIDTWVDNNLNSITDVREILKRVLKMNKYLIKRILTEV
jgi:hypothetical protein